MEASRVVHDTGNDTSRVHDTGIDRYLVSSMSSEKLKYHVHDHDEHRDILSCNVKFEGKQ